MPRSRKYRDVIRDLVEHDARFQVLSRRGKGSHRMIYHPDINGRPASYPLKYHGDDTELGPGYLLDLIRRFNLPRDFFGR